MAAYLPRPFTAHPRPEDTDILVALIRAAAVIAILVFPPETRGLIGAPPHMQQVLVIAILFTFAQMYLFMTARPLQPQRPVALVVDTLLVLSITLTFAKYERNLSELYYLIVIAGALWYGRHGAVTAAIVAIVLSFTVEYLTLAPDPLMLAAEFAITRVPLFLLVAVITSYLVRARDVERQINYEINHELRLARSLQAAMLTQSIPEIAGYELELRFEPARHVGGDLYKVEVLRDGRVLLVLADMAGKSVYGLVHLSALNSHLDAAVSDGLGPAEIAARVNKGTYKALQPDSYAACFIAALDTNAHSLTFVNCGHVPPLLVSADGTAKELSSGGILIGAVESPEYEAVTVELRPGHVLALFTDGISEARNAENVQFGADGIARAIARAREQSGDISRWADAIVKDREAFAGEGHSDDATLLLVAREDAQAAADTDSS